MSATHTDYHAQGYLIERGFISAATIEHLKRRIADALEVVSLADLQFDDARADGGDPMGPERFRKVSGLCRRHRDVWDEFVAAPRAIELNRELVGDNEARRAGTPELPWLLRDGATRPFPGSDPA